MTDRKGLVERIDKMVGPGKMVPIDAGTVCKLSILLQDARDALAQQDGGPDPDRYFIEHGMIHDRHTGRHVSTDDSTGGDMMEVFGRLRSYERMLSCAPRWQEFYDKHAIGSKLAPSCFGCGALWETWERTTRHLELPDIFLCAVCAQRCSSPSPPPAAVDPRIAACERLVEWLRQDPHHLSQLHAEKLQSALRGEK